jgi:hypothetical protein
MHQEEFSKRTRPLTCSVMKNGVSTPSLIVGVALCVSISRVFADDTPATSSVSTSITAAATTATSEQVKLPYGVEDVLKLSRAQVSDDVITTYIQNSGTVYNLGPQDIVYLKEQGVSDRILNTMMDQRRIANEVAAQAQQQQQAAAQQSAAVAVNNGPVTTPAYSDSQQATPEAAQPAASSLYVIPYPTPSYPRYAAGYYSYPYTYSYPYYSYPYSYGYYGYSRPVIGFRFGLGSFHGFHSSVHHHR